MRTWIGCLIVAGIPLLSASRGDGAQVGYYPFDEGSGTTAVDAAGGDDNGTLNGPTYVTPGIVGPSALSFDGVDDRVDLGAGQDFLSGAPGATLAAWITPQADTPLNGARTIISISGGSNVAQARAVIQLVEEGDVNNRLRVGGRKLNGDSFRSVVAPADTALQLGSTYHVAATLDYATNTLALYLNGNQVATGSAAWGAGTTADPSTHLGSIIGAQSTGTGEPYNGVIDDARIYNEVLTPQQIAALVPEPGTAGLAAAAAGLLALRRRR